METLAAQKQIKVLCNMQSATNIIIHNWHLFKLYKRYLQFIRLNHSAQSITQYNKLFLSVANKLCKTPPIQNSALTINQASPDG